MNDQYFDSTHPTDTRESIKRGNRRNRTVNKSTSRFSTLATPDGGLTMQPPASPNRRVFHQSKKGIMFNIFPTLPVRGSNESDNLSQF